MSDADEPCESLGSPTLVSDLNAMVAMIDYLIPQCRGVSPVTTVLLSLARRELITLQLDHQAVIRSMAQRM
jgi:hypothetical protein